MHVPPHVSPHVIIASARRPVLIVMGKRFLDVVAREMDPQSGTISKQTSRAPGAGSAERLNALKLLAF